MDKLIDMHTHSSFSDGDLTPYELVLHAKNNNIKTISITDHDTLLGNQNYFENEQIDGIDVIPGIELTAKVKTGRMHILGYGIDIYDEQLNNKMIELHNNSLYSVIIYLDELKRRHNIVFSTEDIRNLINVNKNIGRPDLAQLCVNYGYCDTVAEAFDKYLISIFVSTRKYTKGISEEECIKLIKDAGGLAILAHPNSLNLNDLDLLKRIKQLIEFGLDGIEVYHSNFSKIESELYYKWANELGILYSGGTDYHGVICKPDIKIGTGRNNNVEIKELKLLNHLNR